MTVWNKATKRLLDDVHNPGEIDRRLARIDDEPVRDLNAWVRTVRDREDEPSIPWFDPLGGGRFADVLLLLQDPSQVASLGSGFISPDNNDPTAQNTTIACERAGLPTERRCGWNVVPWWVADPTKPKRSVTSQVRRAAPYLDELIRDLLPEVTTVVLLGNHAQDAWRNYRPSRAINVLMCPHPGPQSWNNLDPATGRKRSELIVDVLRAAVA